jgi:hypothetical protein
MVILRKSALVLSLSLLSMIGLSSSALAEPGEYSFKVENTSKLTVKTVLVSQDGKKYIHFNCGDGIKPGATMKLVWDKSTDNQECKQWMKALYSDGSESEPAKFDFCEADLVIELF